LTACLIKGNEKGKSVGFQSQAQRDRLLVWKEGKDMRRLKITVGDQVVMAKLLTDEAPETVQIIRSHLPIISRLNHSKICDNEVFFQVPFFIDKKENYRLPTIGDIGFWNIRQTICIWYDSMQPLGPTILFGKIVENLEGFKKEARQTWERQGTPIRIEGA
jgi:hypothetical protein